MAIFSNPRIFQNDSIGAVLKEARLDFYDTGTFDRKATFSDSGLTSTNPNPMVADGSGRFGVIYLNTDSAYRVVLSKKLAPNQYEVVWTQDDVESNPGAQDLVNNVLRGTYFTATGTNAHTITPVIGTPSALQAGMEAYYYAPATSTGTVTVVWAGVTKSMVHPDGTAVGSGDITNGELLHIIYNGTNDNVELRDYYTKFETYNKTETVDLMLAAIPCSATVSTDTLTVTTLNGVYPALANGLTLRITLPSYTATGQTQISYNGTTDGVKWIDGTATASDDIDSTYNKFIRVQFDGTDWLIISDVAGNNSNGDWTKYANGDLVCFSEETITTAINTATGSVFIATNLGGKSYPETFTAAPDVDYTLVDSANISWIGSFTSDTAPSTSAWGQFSLFSTASRASADYIVSYHARGRWY